jgi:hypothetical protein
MVSRHELRLHSPARHCDIDCTANSIESDKQILTNNAGRRGGEGRGGGGQYTNKIFIVNLETMIADTQLQESYKL